MNVLWWLFFTLGATYRFLRYYFKTTVWCRSQTCLVGKTVIVTGANTGIGYEAALDFAKRGARVILACRNNDKAEIARSEIIKDTGNNNVVVKIVDLSSLASVRAFAKSINETEDRLDILVNNAGATETGEGKSEDGLLWLMQVNYFSSFLLTNLLIGLMKKSAPSRIINVSSKSAVHARFDLEKLNTNMGHHQNYSRSKVCNIVFTRELALRLRGTNITTYSLHPGTVKTEIFRHFVGYKKILIDILKALFLKTSEEGAQTIIYTAVAKGIEQYSGEHFDNCTCVEPYKSTVGPNYEKKLWEKSIDFVKLEPHELQL